MTRTAVSKRFAARRQRLAAFPGEGTPPADQACELLCEDHVGTSSVPLLLGERHLAQRQDGRAGKGGCSGVADGRQKLADTSRILEGRHDAGAWLSHGGGGGDATLSPDLSPSTPPQKTVPSFFGCGEFAHRAAA